MENNNKKIKHQEQKDILLVPKPDRRLLNKVPDKENIRTNIDRRNTQGKNFEDFAEQIINESMGIRYLVKFAVQIKAGNNALSVQGESVDLSSTGMLIETDEQKLNELGEAEKYDLAFVITPGSMPEGYEMKVKIAAKLIRTFKKDDGSFLCAFEFEESLAEYANRKKNLYMLSVASFFLFVVTFFVILMRAESVIYFKFNKVLYMYSIIAATFLLSRYLFGSFYKYTPISRDFTPGVTIIIPCFNEEEWINRTILSCINQDYPIDKLEVIMIDDCSTDRSYEVAAKLVEDLKEQEKRYELDDRVHVIKLSQNVGKRDALAIGAKMSKHELLAFVDSDSFLDPFAIRNIVQPFCDNEMGGVTGRTDVANTYTNALTKMQSVRYYIAFRVMKAAESYFDAVTCLSGPLSCYRKDLVMENLDAWVNQRFLGEKATFGDDRSMTNMILRKYRTCYQDSAVCSTIVPNTHSVFLKQQMRWKRSWLRESMIAMTYMWKKEPFMFLSFVVGLLVPFLAPIIVIYNLIFIPIMHRVFPFTFLFGLFLMALLLSMAQLLLRRSTTWLYGLWFVVYYEAVLLWQMPVAWFSFWKGTWGTRMTPIDVAELQTKEKNK